MKKKTITITLIVVLLASIFFLQYNGNENRRIVFFLTIILLGMIILLFITKNPVLVLFTATGLYLVFYFSCLIDNSSTILKIANPMQEKVLAFYKANQRYPDSKEIQELLKESGCSTVEQILFEEENGEYGKEQKFRNICTFGITEIRVTTIFLPRRSSEYSLGYGVRYTGCYITFSDGKTNGLKRVTSCRQRPCIFTNSISG